MKKKSFSLFFLSSLSYFQMQKSFSLAEKQFKYLRNLPKYQWSIVNNKDDFKIYTHSVGPTKTVRVMKDFSSEINLDHFFASLTTLEVRTQCKT